MTAGQIGGPAAQRLARAELTRAEYHRDDPGLISRTETWVLHQLGRLFDGTPAGSATLIVVVLLASVAVFALVRAGRSSAAVRAQATAADPLRPEPARDHRRRAEELAAEGNYREALREWLRATVRTVEERGILDPVPGRSGGEIARAAGAALPTAAAELGAAVDAFGEIWFGDRPASAADEQLGRRADAAVRSARPVLVPDTERYAVPR